MLQKETNYAFRKRMMQVHKKDIRDNSLVAEVSECEIRDGAVIYVSEHAGEVILTAARDFVDFLFVCNNSSANLFCFFNCFNGIAFVCGKIKFGFGLIGYDSFKPID